LFDLVDVEGLTMMGKLGRVPEWALLLLREAARARITEAQRMMIRRHLRAILVILGYIEK
jgi:hypothetical protein